MKTAGFTKRDIYISWFILVTFYLYQYILRSSPGVLIEEIRHSFNMDADGFSLMGSMYYYGYALMQVPLGILIDRIGIRNTALFSIILCIAGTLLLILTDIAAMAYFSRLIVGIGAASAFMSCLKLANDYMPVSQRGFIIGATLTFGAIGALITGIPLNYLLDNFDSWQSSFVVFSLVGLVILLFAFIYLPKNRTAVNIHEFEGKNIWKDLLNISSNKKIIVYTIVTIGLYAPLSVMADLWGTVFLVKKFDLVREIASPILMNIYIGMAIGSIFLPYLAEKYKSIPGIMDKIIKYSVVTLLLLFSVMLFINTISNINLSILLISIGFLCGAEMLCFTAALRYTNSHNSGLTIGVINTFNMLSGALIQQAIGIYLDYSWKGGLDDKGLKIYFTKEFVEAFSILVIIISISAIFAIFALKHKKQKNI